MIAIGNGEPCPLCRPKMDKVFIMCEGANFLEHLMDNHSDQIDDYLFGGKDIGV